MAETIRVSVAYARPHEHFWRDLDVPTGSTCLDAIRVSGVLDDFPDIDLARNKVGVFGHIAPLEQRLHEGDRVEIYRSIRIIPENLQRKRYRLRKMDPVIERSPVR